MIGQSMPAATIDKTPHKSRMKKIKREGERQEPSCTPTTTEKIVDPGTPSSSS
jgi:hypothetical protein